MSSNSSRVPRLLFGVCVLLAVTTVYLWHSQVSERKQQDLISNHPNNLAVAIMKTISDSIDPLFRLNFDEKWYFNDPYEILSTDMDLFYVPK